MTAMTKPSCSTNCCFYSVRSVKTWNRLPASLVMSPSVVVFLKNIICPKYFLNTCLNSGRLYLNFTRYSSLFMFALYPNSLAVHTWFWMAPVANPIITKRIPVRLARTNFSSPLSIPQSNGCRFSINFAVLAHRS